MYQEGIKKGNGVFTYTNGNIYYGNFDCDVRQGEGVLEKANGDRYEGEWLND